MLRGARESVSQWILVTTVAGPASVALEPFDAVPLDLAFLFGR